MTDKESDKNWYSNLLKGAQRVRVPTADGKNPRNEAALQKRTLGEKQMPNLGQTDLRLRAFPTVRRTVTLTAIRIIVDIDLLDVGGWRPTQGRQYTRLISSISEGEELFEAIPDGFNESDALKMGFSSTGWWIA